MSDYDQELIYELRSIELSSYVSCAVIAAFIYDLVTTLDDEVEFVWKGKFNTATFFYLATRYLTFACLCIELRHATVPVHDDDISIEASFYETIVPIAVYCLGNVVMLLSMILLQLRTGALYERRKALFITFCALDVVALAAVVLLAVVQAQDFFGGLLFIWTPLLILETITFALGLRRSIQTYRQFHGSQVRWSPLVKILVRDNILYFIAIFLVYIAGIVINDSASTIPHMFENAHFITSVAVSGFAAPKIYVNLKRSYLEPFVGGQSLPTMHFESKLAQQGLWRTGGSVPTLARNQSEES